MSFLSKLLNGKGFAKFLISLGYFLSTRESFRLFDICLMFLFDFLEVVYRV